MSIIRGSTVSLQVCILLASIYVGDQLETWTILKPSDGLKTGQTALKRASGLQSVPNIHIHTFRLLYSFERRTLLTSSMNLMKSTYAFSSSFCRAASLAARNRALDERPRLHVVCALEGGREGERKCVSGCVSK